MRLNHYNAYMRVAVDECTDGRISGSVYSMRLVEPIRFRDVADLLLQIEAVLDSQDFPRAFQRKRSFNDTQKGNPYPRHDQDEQDEYMDEDTVVSAKGKYTTFALNVITRQNASWQGFLDWLDGSQRQPYNSDIELLSMIQAQLQT